MSNYHSATFALTTMVALLAVAGTGARPKSDLHPWPRQALDDVVNKTLCPMIVTTDRDEHRVPKVIKLVRCAGPAQSDNAEEHASRHQRCNAHAVRGGHEPHDARAHHHSASCVEVFDRVLVYYPGGYGGNPAVKSVTQQVTVGCVCMLQKYVEGLSAPEPET